MAIFTEARRQIGGCHPRVVLALSVSLWIGGAGCALHHFDPATGTEHVWGFGHLKMKVAPPSEGLQAIVRGTDVLGASLGRADGQNYLTVGWHRTQRLDIVEESVAVRVEWPSSDFVSIRVGSRFPFAPQEDDR